MLEAFLADSDVLDLMIDKLFKVLAGADMSKGFPKSDAFIFVQNYFVEHCGLPKLSEEQVDDFATSAKMHNEANTMKHLKEFITRILKHNLEIVQSEITASQVNPKTGLTAL
jgi:hypothetical protein